MFPIPRRTVTYRPRLTTGTLHPSLRHIPLRSCIAPIRPAHDMMVFNNIWASILSAIFIASLFFTSLRSRNACITYGIMAFFLLRTSFVLHKDIVATDNWIAHEITELNVLVQKLAYETRVNARLIERLSEVEAHQQSQGPQSAYMQEGVGFHRQAQRGTGIGMDTSAGILREMEMLRARLLSR